MNAPANIPASYEQVRRDAARLSEDDRRALVVSLLIGEDADWSDAFLDTFHDALSAVDEADAAYARYLDNVRLDPAAYRNLDYFDDRVKDARMGRV